MRLSLGNFRGTRSTAIIIGSAPGPPTTLFVFLAARRQPRRHRGRGGGSPPTALSALLSFSLSKEPRKSLSSPCPSSPPTRHPPRAIVQPCRPSCPSRSPRRFKLLMSIFRLVTLSELVHRRSCVLPIKVFNESAGKMVPRQETTIAFAVVVCSTAIHTQIRTHACRVHFSRLSRPHTNKRQGRSAARNSREKLYTRGERLIAGCVAHAKQSRHK